MTAERHYPISDTAEDCVCGWTPPAIERWRQEIRLDEHMRDARIAVPAATKAT